MDQQPVRRRRRRRRGSNAGLEAARWLTWIIAGIQKIYHWVLLIILLAVIFAVGFALPFFA